MNLTEITINRNRVAISIFVLIIIAGLMQFQSLSQDSMPPFTVRAAGITATFPGASPERVEQLVTKKIEEKVQEVPEIKDITSQSRTGISIITVELKNEVAEGEIQAIWDLIRRKIEILSLPQDATVELHDDGVGEVYGIIIGMTGDGFNYKEMENIADDLRDELIKLDSAAKVEIQGEQEERIYIDYDQSEIARYGLTSSQLESIISNTNILYTGGEINVGPERLSLEPTGNFNDIDDLKSVMISLPNNNIVALGDIAHIYKSYISPPKSMVRVNGETALSIAVSLKENANIVDLGKKVDSLLASYQKNLPYGIELQRITSLDEFVGSEVSNFINNLLQSIGIVLLVMLIFLGLRVGLIIASLIPMVVLATLMYMGIIDMGLNQVTLAALIMALGMMVDNAVVVSESILVKLDTGLSKVEAAIDTCRELFYPLLISTLTTSIAFLSFYLAESQMGDVVGPIFVVITIALVFSWLLSFTMVALLCTWMIKAESIANPSLFDRVVTWLREHYYSLIGFCLRFKYLMLLAIVGVFFGSLTLFGSIPFKFFPDSERNMITVDINLPLGTRIQETEALVEQLEGYIKTDLLVQLSSEAQKPGVLDWAAYVGEGPESYDLGYNADEPNASYAHMLVNTSSGDDNAYVINALDRYATENFPEADIKVKRLGQGGSSTPIEIKVFGSDPSKLLEISDQVRLKLKQAKGSKNVTDNWGIRSKKLSVVIDQDKAQRLGITNREIAYALQSNLTGIQTGEFREGDESLPIMMRNERSESLNIDNLSEMTVYSQSSKSNIPLLEVAKIVPEWQYSRIRHEDLTRTIKISSELKEGFNASDVTGQITDWLNEYQTTWPVGYRYEFGGEDADTAENFGAVLAYLPFCGFIILLLLIIQFNSFRQTFIVVCTIPLGIIGVSTGLLVLNSYFGFMAFLGMISLAGIVINNAIVLIDRIGIELKGTDDPVEAIKDACSQRFRPIMLTTFTTVLGLLPLYLSGGLMWEPMASVLMVGLLVGTLITLIFVPVAYTILYNYKVQKS